MPTANLFEDGDRADAGAASSIGSRAPPAALRSCPQLRRGGVIPVFVWERNDTANQDWSILNRLASRPSAMTDALGKCDGGEVKCSRLRNVGHTPKQNWRRRNTTTNIGTDSLPRLNLGFSSLVN